MTARADERECRRDLWAVAGTVVLFVLAAVIGAAVDRNMYRSDGILRLDRPPMYASWLPHVEPGAPAAPAVAALVVAYGRAAARRLPRWALVPSVWVAATAWTFSPALVDGSGRGFAGRPTTEMGYLRSGGRSTT